MADYKSKVKVETNSIKSSLAAGEFNSQGVIDSNIANVQYARDMNMILSGNPFVKPLYVAPMGGLVIDFLPSIGGRDGSTRFQLGFKDQFVKVVGSAYSSLTLNECDLIKLAMYSEGLYLLIAEVDRALQTYDKFDKVNKVFGKFLVELQGFQWADIAQNKQAWIDARNVLAHIINEKFYLGKSARLERHLNLASKVFATDVNRKTQVVVFRPLEYVHLYSTATWSVGLSSTFGPINNGPGKNIILTQFRTLVNNVRDASMSAWYDDVAPYLHHLYGDSDKDLYKISDYADLKDFAVVYDSNILNLVRNIRLTGKVYKNLNGGGTDNSVYIAEDATGHITQGGWDGGTYVNNSHGMILDYEAKLGANDDPLLVIYQDSYNVDDYPITEDSLFAALLARYEQNFHADGVLLTRSPTTLFTSAFFAFTDEGDDGDITGRIIVYNYVIDASGYSSVTSKSYGLGQATYEADFSEARNFSSFGVYPYQVCIKSPDTPSSLIMDIYHNDVDNEYRVPRDIWLQFQTAEVYESSKFTVPDFKSRK